MNDLAQTWLHKALVWRTYKAGAETNAGRTVYTAYMRFAFEAMLKRHPMN